MPLLDSILVKRCPYCVVGFEFRLLIAYKDGRFVCEHCGHTTHPGDSAYQCSCSNCLRLRNRQSAGSR